MAAAAGLLGGWWLADDGGGKPLLPAAIACGGLLAVAAIGRLPRGVVDGGRQPWRLPLVWRLAWPIAGLLAGGWLAAWVDAAGGQWRSWVAVGVAAATALAAAVIARRPPRTETATASCLLGITAAAAGAALAVWAGGGGVAGQGLAGLLAWGVLAAAIAVDHGGDPLDWLALAAERGRGPEAGQVVAMTAALVAMVGWYFLAPQFAWGYAVLAAGLFVCLAVPPATDFSPAAAGFARTLAGRPPLPGTLARAVRGTGVQTAILVWPALVAVALPAAAGVRVGGPLVALLWLGAIAGWLLATVALAIRSGQGETARGAVLAAAAVALVLAARRGGLLDCLPSPVFLGS